MATRSIIDIEVNDKAFKDFADRFNAYREGLKKTPGMWAKVEGATGEVKANFEDMAALMLVQNDLLAKLVIHHNAASRASGKVKSDFQSIARDAQKITGNLLKWGGIGIGIATGALAGLAALGFAAGNQRRSAQGIGVTTGQQAALNTQYGRYFDVNSNLENIANAKSDYSQRWAFGAMGINPSGKDPAQLAVEMAMRAKTIFDAGGGSQQEAQAHGLLQFYTMDELRRLHATSMKDLQASEGAYGRDVGRLSRQDAINKQWQDFGIRLKESGQVIENVFIKRLSPLAEPLGVFAKDVADMLDTFMANKDFGKWIEDAGQGLKNFGSYVGTEAFQTKVKNFASDMVDIADAIHAGLLKIGVLKDHSAENALTTSFSVNPKQKGAALEVMRQFEAAGWSQNAAAGIAANLNAESAMNPFARGDLNKKTGAYDAYGIAQWHADRQAEYARKFGHTMQSVKDPTQAFNEQLAFVQYELQKGKYKSIGDMVKAQSRNAAEAGNLISQGYERPKDDFWRTVAKARGSQAQVLVNIQNSTGGSAQATVAQVAQ